MSFFGDLLGIGGGSHAGTNFQPTKVDPLNPTTLDQATNAYGQAQTGINNQANFLAALQAQNGIGNQANVFNQQQALANQYQNLANGNGPNPALQQLQNTTGQNVANQAALMASQRGTGANAGLIARQAAQQGANIQQQAVGQGATLQAQQQLAGLQGLQQQQGMLGNLANQQVAQQANATQGYNQAAQSEQQNLLNSIAQYNNANVAAQSNVNNVSGQLANTTAQGQQGLLGGALGGVGSLFGLAGGAGPVGGAINVNADQAASGGGGSSASSGASYLNEAHGGMIPPSAHYASGGDVQINLDPSMMNGPVSNAGRFLYSSAPSQVTDALPDLPSQPFANYGASSLNSGMAGLIGPAIGLAAMAASKGAMVPGKASVKGDSLKNDTVPAMLSPGEVVIPRHVMQSGDPVGNAAKFVQAVMAKKGLRGGLSK